MANEIERIAHMKPPQPNEFLQGIATMQAFTIGLLLAGHISLHLKLSKRNVKEVVVVVKEAKDREVINGFHA